LPITFQYVDIIIPVKDALVDTGADQTLLPLAFAVQFGFRFDLKRDGVEWSGAGGGKFRVFLAPEPITFILEQTGFRRIQWTGLVSFTLDQPTILLGHKGCLQHLNIMFRGREKILEVNAA
jgi:hypothetical protein